MKVKVSHLACSIAEAARGDRGGQRHHPPARRRP
jgi:hypothetical protein